MYYQVCGEIVNSSGIALKQSIVFLLATTDSETGRLYTLLPAPVNHCMVAGY